MLKPQTYRVRDGVQKALSRSLYIGIISTRLVFAFPLVFLTLLRVVVVCFCSSCSPVLRQTTRDMKVEMEIQRVGYVDIHGGR